MSVIVQRRYTSQRAEPAELDSLLLWSAIALLLFGLVMVYSASIATAEGSQFTGHQPAYFLIRHGVFLAIGIVVGTVAFQIPLRVWQQAAPWLFLGGVALLIVVILPHVGRSVNGAQRWLPLGWVNLQPSELMKLFAVLYAADYTTRKLGDMGSFRRGFVPMAIVMMLVGFLLLREPDFGAFVVIVAIAMGILFLGGINAPMFGALLLLLCLAFVALVASSEYRYQRILGFMDPWQDAYGKGYQLSHALIFRLFGLIQPDHIPATAVLRGLEPVLACVHRYPVYPSRDGRLGPEIFQRPVDLYERLLRAVVGFAVITHKTVA